MMRRHCEAVILPSFWLFGSNKPKPKQFDKKIIGNDKPPLNAITDLLSI